MERVSWINNVKPAERITWAVILISFIAVIVSCSKDKSTDPVEQTNANELLYMELFNASSADSVEMVIADSVRTELEITPEIADSAAFTLEDEDNYILIPDGAVADSIAISIKFDRIRFVRGNDSNLSALVFECAPEGQTFSESLIFDIFVGYFNNHTSSNAVKLYLYNSTTKRWSLQATKQKNNPPLRFNIAHFSKYAISD